MNNDTIVVKVSVLQEMLERIDAERVLFDSDPTLSAFYDGQISIIEKLFEQGG